MKHLKYADIELRTSELTTFKQSVPEWEIPLLELVHGRSAVKRVGESLRSVMVRKRLRSGGEELVERVPTGATEYERLAKRYRRSQTEDGGVGPAFVAVLYGEYGVGEINLQRAIDAATVDVQSTAEVPCVDPEDNIDLIGEQVSSVGG